MSSVGGIGVIGGIKDVGGVGDIGRESGRRDIVVGDIGGIRVGGIGIMRVDDISGIEVVVGIYGIRNVGDISGIGVVE